MTFDQLPIFMAGVLWGIEIAGVLAGLLTFVAFRWWWRQDGEVR